MGRVQRLIRLFEGGVTSIRRATRRSPFKRSSNPKGHASDSLHRTAQSAKAPLFRRRVASAPPELKASQLPQRDPVPAKAPAPVAVKRAVPPRQTPKPHHPAAHWKRPAWDFGYTKARENSEVFEIGASSPDSLQLQVDSRFLQSAAPSAAVIAPAGRHVSHGGEPAAPEPVAAAADAVALAADRPPVPAAAADCPLQPCASEPEPAVDPAAAPLPISAPALPPPPIGPPPITPPSPLTEETKRLVVGPGFPADEVLWALRGQALGRGHPHLLQLREVEMQPQQLAVVVDRGLSNVQDLIDNTACMGAPASEATVQRLFQQLVVGLAFCHRQGMSRASVHPRNLTLHASDDAPAAGSRQLGEGCSLAVKSHDFSATMAAAAAGGDGGADLAAWLCTEQDPSYSAPEVIEARLSNGEAPPVAHAAADVWSAGAILFALLSGGPPFSRPSDAALPPQPKAVATLLRINTGSRSAVHSQVSDECRDVLRQALEADVTKRISLPTLLAHPWVTRDMPPALRSVNAELLAAPGGGQSRRQEAAAAGPAAGVKRHRSGELPMQAAKRTAKRTAIVTLEELLAARVTGPLRQRYGTAAAVSPFAHPQQQAEAALSDEAALFDEMLAAAAAEADSHHPQQLPDSAQAAAEHAQPSPGLLFPAAVAWQSSPAAPLHLMPTAAESQSEQLQLPFDAALSACATEPSTPPSRHSVDKLAAYPESLVAEPEADAVSEQLLASPAGADDSIERIEQAFAGPDFTEQAAAELEAIEQAFADPDFTHQASAELEAIEQAFAETESFDSPPSLQLPATPPLAGSLRQRFGSSLLPPLARRVHSPLDRQLGGCAAGVRADVHALSPAAGGAISFAQATPRNPDSSGGADTPLGGNRGSVTAAAEGNGGATVAQLLHGNRPRHLVSMAKAESLGSDSDAGTGFQRFSEDSAYRRRPAKLTAKHLISAGPHGLQSPAVRALDFGSRSTSGGASPVAHSPAPSARSASPVASVHSPSPVAYSPAPSMHSPSPAASHSRAASVASPCLTPFAADSPRLPAAAASQPAAPAALSRRHSIPLLRLDKLPKPAPLAEVAKPCAAKPARHPRVRAAAPAATAKPPPAAAAADPAPLKVSGKELCSTAALVRVVAAAAFAARSAPSGDHDRSGHAEAGAAWGGPTLQQRQERALEHSGRLHTCYMQLLAAGGA